MACPWAREHQLPGTGEGHLAIAAVLKATYTLGKHSFSVLYLDQELVEEVMRDAGFDIKYSAVCCSRLFRLHRPGLPGRVQARGCASQVKNEQEKAQPAGDWASAHPLNQRSPEG